MMKKHVKLSGSIQRLEHLTFIFFHCSPTTSCARSGLHVDPPKLEGAALHELLEQSTWAVTSWPRVGWVIICRGLYPSQLCRDPYEPTKISWFMSAKGFVERNAHLLVKFAAVREVHDQEASDQRCWTNEGSFFNQHLAASLLIFFLFKTSKMEMEVSLTIMMNLYTFEYQLKVL